MGMVISTRGNANRGVTHSFLKEGKVEDAILTRGCPHGGCRKAIHSQGKAWLLTALLLESPTAQAVGNSGARVRLEGGGGRFGASHEKGVEG